MADISEITDLTNADWLAFENAGISTLEQLWTNVDECQAANRGRCLAALNAATKIPQDRLAAYLSAAAVLQGERFAGTSELSMHRRSLAFLVVAAGMIVLTLLLVGIKPASSFAAADVRNRSLISLSAKGLSSDALAKLPAKVSLVFSPRTGSEAPVPVDQVLLLSADQTSGLFAILKEDLPKVEPVLGKDDAFVFAAAP